MSELPAVGARATVEHVFTQEDVVTFARLSGDDNPIHLDDAAARAAGFAGPIVHGTLVMGLFSRLLGTQMPGAGTIYLGQELRFSSPVYPGATVRAYVEVTAVRPDKPVVTLRTWAETDEIVLDGTATVLVRGSGGPRSGA